MKQKLALLMALALMSSPCIAARAEEAGAPGGGNAFLRWRSGAATSRTPLGSAELALAGTEALKHNVELAASSISDTVLLSGDLFSFNDTVGERSAENGYEVAVNGRGVEVVGGGVAQVASALWLAVQNLDCVAIVEKHSYGERYNQSYVDNSNDAILTDYNNETDFSFRNVGKDALTVVTYVAEGALRCEIYAG